MLFLKSPLSPSLFPSLTEQIFENRVFHLQSICNGGETNLPFKVAHSSRVPVWALAAGLIASPVEWQLLKGFLNCTQVDGWLSGGQRTEDSARGKKTDQGGKERGEWGDLSQWRTVTLTAMSAGKRNVLDPGMI